ncbi:class I SAM-dependent methyltransferase [Falsiroseomonas sp. HW251]|uniref:class I SAM-dependent methyltransferase n=1 Tax=Falsiroseomonas sp. HW251 TaxID=3390998 RepID=UPI003D31016A
MTSGWGDGYVTDIGYDGGYYREQSPGQLQLACLLCGVDWDVPAEGAHYVELGCGLGLGALIVAAANPGWRVTALDFNPAHIASARAMAREAGLGNVTFLEADLAHFAETPACAALPDADIVTAHGVWSWVSEEVQAGIVRLLQAKLRPGGIMHLSYNALPGWQGMLAVQRTIREAGLRMATRSDRQAQRGLEVLRDLANAEATALRADPRTSMWITESTVYSPAYLAHEFMNGHWKPCWQSDVAAALSGARLDFVGAATLIENFPELAMTAQQRAVWDRFEDPIMQELVKDLCLARTLRHDIYVRGGRRLGVAQRDAALRELHVALLMPPDKVALEVQIGSIKAELSREFYGPVIERLARGPARVGDLLHLPGSVAQRENPAELTGLLVGMRQVVVAVRPEAGCEDAVRRLNTVFARRFAQLENLNRGFTLASAMVGAGVNCSMLDLYAAGRLLEGETEVDTAGWTQALVGHLSAEDQGKIEAAFNEVRNSSLPRLRALGCAPA